MRSPTPVSSTNMKDNLPLSLFMCDLKSSFPPVTIAPGFMLVISSTSGSYHRIKSQLFIPLDGTSLNLIGISTVSPGLPDTVAISTINEPGCIVGFGVCVGFSVGPTVGFGVCVGCGESPPGSTPHTN